MPQSIVACCPAKAVWSMILSRFPLPCRIVNRVRGKSLRAMAGPVRSGTRTQEELQPHLCHDCEGAPAPEVGTWEAVTQFGRTLLSLCGGGAETSKVATRSLHDLSARLISGESVKFDMFKGKVLLVVNVATQ
eukprot:s178_g14.t1